MSTLIMKFGGSSLSDVDQIKKAAARVVALKKKDYDIIVVVSAMGKTTDTLLDQIYSVNSNPPEREISTMVSTGEIVSSAMFSSAVAALGYESVSLNGLQSGITTNSSYTDAKIEDIDITAIRKYLKSGKIVIVTGYQGFNGNEVNLLGRGGSDVTAIAIAVKIDAEYCDIYSDVPGVYSADPNVINEAKLLNNISYDSMIAMATSGANVLMTRSVELAKKYSKTIRLYSSVDYTCGTIINKGDDMEGSTITGVASIPNIELYSFNVKKKNSNQPVNVFEYFVETGIKIKLYDIIRIDIDNWKIDLVVESEGSRNINPDFLPDTLKIVEYSRNKSLISVVGTNFECIGSFVPKIIDLFLNSGITIHKLINSASKISVLVDTDSEEKALNVLHKSLIIERL